MSRISVHLSQDPMLYSSNARKKLRLFRISPQKSCLITSVRPVTSGRAGTTPAALANWAPVRLPPSPPGSPPKMLQHSVPHAPFAGLWEGGGGHGHTQSLFDAGSHLGSENLSWSD